MIDRPEATRNSDDALDNPFRNWTARKSTGRPESTLRLASRPSRRPPNLAARIARRKGGGLLRTRLKFQEEPHSEEPSGRTCRTASRRVALRVLRTHLADFGVGRKVVLAVLIAPVDH